MRGPGGWGPSKAGDSPCLPHRTRALWCFNTRSSPASVHQLAPSPEWREGWAPGRQRVGHFSLWKCISFHFQNSLAQVGLPLLPLCCNGTTCLP